ncbi:MAG: cation diffusion facilitator family transporter [Cyclobacteriaceae bacterium]|jgi:cation diffusion facilitator family transporter|nr:cation diffusion facilitator family transporter [Flammeovirgaceae bacterium]
MMPLERQKINLQRWVVGLAVVLFVGKVAAYWLTQSVAILTDALESIVNVVAGLFGLYSLTLSAKPRDADHPYGHGKIEFISAAVEGTLIIVASGFILYESIHNLVVPRTLHQLNFGIALIGVTALLNFIMGSVCVRAGRKSNSLALVASGKHLVSDTWSTVGIIAGLVLIALTGIQWIDSIVAIVFGVIIFVTGYKILRSSLAGIMDESDRELLAKMVSRLNQHREENWIDLHNTRIIKFGSVLHLDAHLTVPWYLNVHEAHNEIDRLAGRVREEFGETLELYVHSDGCLDFSCKICSKPGCPARQSPFEKRIEWTVQNISQNQKHRVSTP